MSKFYKSCLALAVAAALPAVSVAATFKPDTAHLAIHAQEAVIDDAATASNASVVDYVLKAGDFLIGRTTPVKVVVNLTGAQFAGATGAIATSAKGTITAQSTAPGSYSFVFTPAAALAATDVVFRFEAGAVKLTKLPKGGAVTAAISIQDVTTSVELMSTTGTIMTVAMGTSAKSAANSGAQQIDVTKGKLQFVGGSKTVLLGTVDVGFVDGDTSSLASVEKVSVEGSGITANGDGAGATSQIVFASAGADMLSLTVAAADISAFKPITGDATTAAAGLYVTADATCADLGQASTDIKLVASTTSPNEFSGKIGIPAAGQKFNVCAIANGKTVISNKGFTASGKVDFADAKMVDYAIAGGALATLMYNGPVAEVWSFNPASNADQLSYLRVSNTSSTSGKITIDGVCDSGVASKTPASLNLAAGTSVLLTSIDIEVGNPAKGMGNGLGSCNGGKYRLTVTGEVGSMNVQNFLRNVTSGGLINTNVNNEK